MAGFAQSTSFAVAAIAHFVIGYAIAGALMARPLTRLAALVAILAAGAFTRIALAFGVPEILFAPLGPLAAIACADWTTARNLASSVAAFVVGFAVVLWLRP